MWDLGLGADAPIVVTSRVDAHHLWVQERLRWDPVHFTDPWGQLVPLPSSTAHVHSKDAEPLRTCYMMFNILCVMSPRRMESILLTVP